MHREEGTVSTGEICADAEDKMFNIKVDRRYIVNQ